MVKSEQGRKKAENIKNWQKDGCWVPGPQEQIQYRTTEQ